MVEGSADDYRTAARKQRVRDMCGIANGDGKRVLVADLGHDLPPPMHLHPLMNLVTTMKGQRSRPGQSLRSRQVLKGRSPFQETLHCLSAMLPALHSRWCSVGSRLI